MYNLNDKLHKVYDRVHAAVAQSGRAPNSVQLLAVSKTQPASSIKTLYDAGHRAFGENYLQEALKKQSLLSTLDIEWHFIGPIQSNKTQDIASNFDWVHSVDRLKIAKRLNDQRPEHLPPLNICLQINIDKEASKSGISIDNMDGILDLAKAVVDLPHLRLRGLMAIPKANSDTSKQRDAFAKVTQLFESLKTALDRLGLVSSTLDTLSMGMSGDMESAISEGATIVRVGTDIFGPRNNLL
ncbi:MAG: YggS family pyridoxal phosphate-dependent enzyme [Cellvibrionaceae bacterium]